MASGLGLADIFEWILSGRRFKHIQVQGLKVLGSFVKRRSECQVATSPHDLVFSRDFAITLPVASVLPPLLQWSDSCAAGPCNSVGGNKWKVRTGLELKWFMNWSARIPTADLFVGHLPLWQKQPGTVPLLEAKLGGSETNRINLSFWLISWRRRWPTLHVGVDLGKCRIIHPCSFKLVTNTEAKLVAHQCLKLLCEFQDGNHRII